MRHVPRSVATSIVAVLLICAADRAQAESLCDPSFQNCRTRLLALIDNERVGIDVAFWFMTDQRYVSHLISRWRAGVRVRVLADPRANPDYPVNATTLSALKSAGIPIRKKSGGGIMHWKMMLFAGQNVVEFGAANFSERAFVPASPYTNYVSESIYFCDDPAVVNSFKTKYDSVWINTTSYSNYANVGSLSRRYPIYALDPALNVPPGQSYATRAVNLYNAETNRIDVNMYRVTDRRHTDALIAAWKRGVPIRYFGETSEYRSTRRLWVSWNMDRIYAAGIPMRVRAHLGLEHQKVVILYGQATAIFGSSNWTSPSANYQLEHNYFTKKSWIFYWFVDQFERRWFNQAGYAESKPFVPLGPGKPVYKWPASGATGLPTSGTVLKWYGGPWAHVYDVYFGTSYPPPKYAANLALGPSETTTDYQRFTLPTLASGRTYYWKIVSKTMANKTGTGVIASFRTQ